MAKKDRLSQKIEIMSHKLIINRKSRMKRKLEIVHLKGLHGDQISPKK